MAGGPLSGCCLGVAPKVIAAWRARAAVEALSRLRDHPRLLMLTLLAALLYERQPEITDTLADLLISTVHRIGARADQLGRAVYPRRDQHAATVGLQRVGLARPGTL